MPHEDTLPECGISPAFGPRSTFGCVLRWCETGTSGQRRSHGNIELVRVLDSYEGSGARAVFAGVQLFMTVLPKSPTVNGFTTK